MIAGQKSNRNLNQTRLENGRHVDDTTAKLATQSRWLRPTTKTTTTQLTILFLALAASGCQGFGQYDEWTQTSRQINDGPVETDIRQDEGRQGFVGCLYDLNLCNDAEVCLDDSLFGRCAAVDDDDNNNSDEAELYDTQNKLSSSDADLIRLELQQLSSSGFSWSHPYTQCVVQNTITSILGDLPFDVAECDLFLPASVDPLGDEDIVLLPSDLDDDLEGGEYEQEEELGGQESVVPKKMPIAFEDEEYDSDPSYSYDSILDGDDNEGNVVEIDQESDGSLVIMAPDNPELLDAVVARVNSIAEQQGSTNLEDIIPFLQQENPDLVVYEESDVSDGDNEVELVNDGDDIEKLEELEEEEPSVEDYQSVEDYARSAIEALEAERERPSRTMSKRGGQYNYDDTDDSITANIEDWPPRLSSDLLDWPRITDYDYDGPSEQHLQTEKPSELGLGSYIFNRRGRLDVKKPGPFYPNSANNFFLDKLIDYDYTIGENEKNDTGQAEYEMPLLAPPPPADHDLKLTVEEPELNNKDAEDYVHIATKRRFSTWRQGSDFIEFLADEFGIPQHALTDRMIENQHVQFHVAPNPNQLNAAHMAKRIDEDSGLHGRINSQLGVEIDKAASGHRDDASRVIYSPIKMSNVNLALVLVVLVSSAAAILSVVTILLICKRRRARTSRMSQKLHNEADEMEKGKAQEEYKQLCRDWSRSGKKVDNPSSSSPPPSSSSQAPTPPASKKLSLKSVDSNNSMTNNDRSSTSSNPGSEEVLPNTSNMDISTGHLVLAYMEDHLKNKQRLEQEWVALCGYEADPCATTNAFKAENKKKNRYPDKLPYDHNRVILNAMVNATNSDYINASTITDHDPRNPSYIVTQAPLASTVADFWQMIWEQGCVVIVMLTRLQDNGLQLCQRYWPEEGSEQYHIFEVHLVSEHVWCDEYLVRSVYLKNTRSGETRTVTQFHFRAWPSHGVPTSTKAMLEFRRKVNKSYRGRSCPIAVHCSDGVGRSGTYVLIDMVLNRMSKGCKEIDIAAALEHIRDQRGGGMVQSRGQFEFCLMAVAEEVHAILKALPQ